MRTFTAVPAMSVRPTSAGIEVTVRYITRATERYEVRSRLYRALVDILQPKRPSKRLHLCPRIQPTSGSSSLFSSFYALDAIWAHIVGC